MNALSTRRAGAVAVALACTALGVLLASHYPIAPIVVIVLFLTLATMNYRLPFAWLYVIPALLPIAGFATWTGWFAFEELDLLVLGAAAGGYARLAWPVQSSDWVEDRLSPRPSLIPIILAALIALSFGISLYRGIVDAGGLKFDWIGDYEGAMNSLRLCKSFASALLLWPLLQSAFRMDEHRATNLLAAGLALGLGGASLAALWERAAFTDVLDFSSEYRTTALFWEMHVGGAALDGFLALTVPFAVWELGRKSGRWRTVSALALVALAAYACLTTYSRGVYLAIPIGLALFGLLVMAQRRTKSDGLSLASVGRSVALTTLVGVAFYFVFREGGYRALLAFCATMGVALHVTSVGRGIGWRRLLLAFGIGVSLGVLDALLAPLIPKGPYVLFALAFACNIGLLLWDRSPRPPWLGTTRWAMLIWLCAAGAVVALHWGGQGAFRDSTVAMLGLLLLVVHNSVARNPWAHTGTRRQMLWLGMLALTAGTVVVFAGGAYMGGRFATTSSDLDLRIRHWRDGIGLLHGTPDWAFGKGLGRFPASYFFGVPDGDFPGSLSLHVSHERRFLSLAGPAAPTAWGNLFRLAQRVDAVPGLYTALLDVRTRQNVALHVEVCEQNLLYNGTCAAKAITIAESPEWQRVSVVLDGRGISGGPWYAPRLALFSISVASNGQLVDVDDVALIGPDGNNILRNGTFADGTARWIPISEKFHLPWHIKNLALNLLFDQGILGMSLFILLFGAALWRLTLGVARQHLLAPALAASLVGFVVVGAFDSLLDVPRVAFLFYLLILVSSSLPTPKSAAYAARA